MDKANNNQYKFMRSTYVMGGGIYILAMDEDGEPYTDVTVNLADIKLEPDCILIPEDKKNDEIIQYFYKQFVDHKIERIVYGSFDSIAEMVQLKADWKKSIKPIC